MKNLHIKKNHCSFKKLLNEYYVCGYTFKGITGISKTIIKYCSTCSQKNIKLLKREPTQQIIFKKPLERFLADITEIPYEIYGESQYRYLLNIIEHFSKFCVGYLCQDKKSETILNLVKDCFNKIGIPEEFGNDNGTEFKNKYMVEFLKSKNIKFVHGKAYNPRSQGYVGRLHRTLKTGLICLKLDKNNNFNLERDFNYVVYNYNNIIHNTTGYKPIEIFYTSSDGSLERVFENTLNSFKNLNLNKSIFDIYEKVLLCNNFIINKSKSTGNIKYLIRNKIKKIKHFIKFVQL